MGCERRPPEAWHRQEDRPRLQSETYRDPLLERRAIFAAGAAVIAALLALGLMWWVLHMSIGVL